MPGWGMGDRGSDEGTGEGLPAADVKWAPSYRRRAGVGMGVEMVLDVGCVACKLHRQS